MISVGVLMMFFLILGFIASIIAIIFVIMGSSQTDVYTIGLVCCCAMTTGCLLMATILYISYYCIG